MGPWLVVIACVLVLIVGLLSPTQKEMPPGPAASTATNACDDSQRAGSLPGLPESQLARKTGDAPRPEEIVGRRLKQFSSRQRALVHKLAELHHLDVPPDVDRFFDALDAGDWEEARHIYRTLRDGDNNSRGREEAMRQFWRPIQEAYGAAEQAQLWPAQQFLDYGNGILDSLRPGMVYIGGTDPGCFICTMLNATSDGEQHVTLTQNALADSNYLEFLRASGDGSLNIPTPADSQAAFDQYAQDATARFTHDQQFPDEPKQVLPGENLAMTDGKITWSGVTSVMAINNILMQDLMQANPGVSFAMEESYPLPSLYAGAAPLGPVLALNANGDGQSAITPESANATVSYWQNMAQTLAANPEASGAWATMIAYAHDAAAQGNLLANSNYPDQAAQAYQTALGLAPDCADAVEGLAKVLAGQGQYNEANQALDSFVQTNPKQSQAIAAFRAFYIGGQ
jgi:tetratricopeptide (TPR) repeat protein